MSVLGFYHKLIPLRVRYKLYSIPYVIAINKYLKDLNIDKLPLFNYIEIETINRCNNDCPFCPVNVNQPQREFAKMSQALFEKIIDELYDLSFDGVINLFSNNEPLLDSRIAEFAKYTREKLPNCKIRILTNGILLTVEELQKIGPSQKSVDG